MDDNVKQSMIITVEQFETLIARNEETLRSKIAIAAMQGIISTAGKDTYNPWSFSGDDFKKIARDAVSFADALIKELEDE